MRAHRRVHMLVDRVVLALLQDLQRLHVGQRVVTGALRIGIVADRRPARRQRRELRIAAAMDELAVGLAPRLPGALAPINRAELLAGPVEPALLEAGVGLDQVQDCDLAVGLVAARLVRDLGDAVVGPALLDLAVGVHEAPRQRVDPAAPVEAQPVFAGRQRVEADHVLAVELDDRAAGAELAQLLVDQRQRRIEVAGVEHHAHALGALVEPDLHRRQRGYATVGNGEPEPGPRRRGDARHQARHQRAQREQRRGVEDRAVGLRAAPALVGRREELAAPRIDEAREVAPARLPRMTLALQHREAGVDVAAKRGIVRHRSGPQQGLAASSTGTGATDARPARRTRRGGRGVYR